MVFKTLLKKVDAEILGGVALRRVRGNYSAVKRVSRICKTAAPEGRNMLAQDVSPGNKWNTTEFRRDGTGSHDGLQRCG